MRDATQRWQVGEIRLTAVVEACNEGIPPQFFFPEATADDVRSVGWLGEQGDDRYARADGSIAMSVQAFVIEVGGRTVLVDPCVGNGKARTFPFWNELDLPWLDRLRDAGYRPEDIDLVVHTHLHADHVGWDTHRTDEGWVPTFTRARHVYVGDELDFRQQDDGLGEDVHGDSIAPVFAAGLAEVVDAGADIGGGLRRLPTPGHTPGHVSLDVRSPAGDRLVVTGDIVHHPGQLTRTDWAEIGDADPERARSTRRAFFDEHAHAGTLLAGTHFPSHPVGRACSHAGAWRFEPEPGTPLTGG